MTGRVLIAFITLFLLLVTLPWLYQKRAIKHVATTILPTSPLKQSVVDEDNPFSIYEDLKAGFKFAYPEGFRIRSLDNQIEVLPPSGKGKIIIQITDNSFEAEIVEDNLLTNLPPEESVILQNAENMIRDTFKFTGQKYSEKELFERFMNSSPSGTLGN